MATIPTSSEPKPLKIDNFYGLNLNGETQLKIGESPNMDNFYITNSYDITKIEGYKQMMKTVNSTKKIQGMWHGFLNGTEHFIFACNGHIYKVANGYWNDDTVWESTNEFTTHVTDLGTLTDDKTSFFEFNNKLYMLNGHEYKSWPGTGQISDVAGYIPKVYINTSPAGVGTAYEQVNQLTGKKHQTFNGDNTTAIYQLIETGIASVDSVYVNGTLKTVTTHYTVDLANGKVTFTSGNIPSTGLDNVDIYWTKENTTPTAVTQCKYATLFGPNNNTRVFLYGNSSYPNRRIHSDLANGVPSVEYFPINNKDDIGSSGEAITDITKQYDRMLITKPGEAYYSVYETYTQDTVDLIYFPIYPLNTSVGNVAFGQGQLIDNYPITIDRGLREWVTTNIQDEKNNNFISGRIQPALNNLDLTKAITVDWQERNEYWLVVDNKVYIYNYRIYGMENGKTVRGVFSPLTLKHTPTWLMVVNGELYFGTTDGLIMKFSDNFLTFNGDSASSHWESGFMDFGANHLTKTMTELWVGMQPKLKTSASINYVTDKNGLGIKPATISYQEQIFELGKVDFGDFSFQISSNPQPKHIKLKAKNFTYLKITIDNNSSTDTCKILNISIPVEYGSKSK